LDNAGQLIESGLIGLQRFRLFALHTP
jgi:hypothetical protein